MLPYVIRSSVCCAALICYRQGTGEIINHHTECTCRVMCVNMHVVFLLSSHASMNTKQINLQNTMYTMCPFHQSDHHRMAALHEHKGIVFKIYLLFLILSWDSENKLFSFWVSTGQMSNISSISIYWKYIHTPCRVKHDPFCHFRTCFWSFSTEVYTLVKCKRMSQYF